VPTVRVGGVVFDDVVVDVPAKALMAKPVAMEKIRAL
jgi:hypothetical protein